MSIPLSFDMLDSSGNVLALNVRLSSITLLCDVYNLNRIHEELFDTLNNPMILYDHNWAYAIPCQLYDYMFDLNTHELCPNKWK